MKTKKEKTSKRRAHFEKAARTDAPAGKPRKFKGPQKFKGRVAHKPESKPEKKPSALPASQTIVGVVRKANYGWALETTDRKDKTRYILRNPAKAEDKAGSLVAARLLPSTKRGLQEVELTHDLGNPDDPRNISLIAIHANEIPDLFPDEVIAESKKLKPPSLGDRTDLRPIPLVTIDGSDARDFDDAVFAEKDGSGWHLIVAIADVAHYVPAGSLLDREAFKRGNSTYFPDRVVPMLPEVLSNDLCSLRPDVDRASMAVHMWIDKAGELTRWKFERALIRSHARLTYEQVQAAKDGQPDEKTKNLLDKVILPLYGAYDCLMAARVKRGTLELDLPERKVIMAADGSVATITVRERLDSHRLIEEFMIAANVAAAAQLEGKGGVCLYRIHDKPTEMKLDALRDFLDTLGISLVPAKQLHPRMLTQILENAAGTEHAQVVNEVMLRSQAQAVYSRDNIGHFGLALSKYAHFTSPIRRYADLVVHRGLIRALKLGADGLSDHEIERLDEIGDHISSTERRSAMAEREAIDRFVTLYLADKIDGTFDGQVSGVARFGLFVRLNETGADGIVPFNALPNDYYELDEKRHALVGQKRGRVYQLGAKVRVRLDSADKLTGSMSFTILEEDVKPKTHKKSKESRAAFKRRRR